MYKNLQYCSGIKSKLSKHRNTESPISTVKRQLLIFYLIGWTHWESDQISIILAPFLPVQVLI